MKVDHVISVMPSQTGPTIYLSLDSGGGFTVSLIKPLAVTLLLSHHTVQEMSLLYDTRCFIYPYITSVGILF